MSTIMCYNVICVIPFFCCLEIVNMGRGNKFPLNENDLVRLYKGGMSKVALSRHFGCSQKVVGVRLAKLGFPVASREDSQKHRRIVIDPDEILSLYVAGMTKVSIAKYYGCAESLIGKRLADLGFPTAPTRSEAMKIRLARMTAQERLALTKPAHDAVRGMKRTYADLRKRALGNERAGKVRGRAETTLYKMLIEKRVNATPQKAIGKYNVDFAIGTVAVEIFGRAKKDEALAILPKRIKYILNSGWTLVVVWANDRCPISNTAADYIISLSEHAGRDPSLRGQYRVIRGNGDFFAEGSSKSNKLPGILTSVPNQRHWP